MEIEYTVKTASALKLNSRSVGGFSIVKQGVHLSKPPGKSNSTKTQKCELMQELPNGCNNIFIMGDLQRRMLQTLSLPRKACREASPQGSLWALEQPRTESKSKSGSGAARQLSSTEAQESRPQLLIGRFTCKYLLQRGRGATRLVFRTNVENTTLH